MPSNSLSTAAQQNIKALVQAKVDEKSLPPYFVSVLTAEGELLSTSVGEVDRDTVLRLFSMTKLITSLAILQLIDRGRLSLDTEAGTFLPGLVAPRIITGHTPEGEAIFVPAENKVTILQLMNHSCGLSRDKYSADLTRYLTEKDWSGVSLEERYFTEPLIHEPGTDFAYSPATDYLGRIVEVISGGTLEEYFQANIFKPLSMTSTSFILTPALKARATLPSHMHDPLTPFNTNIVLIPESGHPLSIVHLIPDDPPIQFGAWGLMGTFHDYSLLLQHLLQLAPSSTVKSRVAPIISEESWKSLFKGTLSKEAKVGLARREENVLEREAGRVGMDWSTAMLVNGEDLEGRRKKGSGTWYGALHAHFMIDPTTGIAILGGTQLLPDDDKVAFDLWKQIELEVYAGLE